jgi:hypothetical protein
VIASVKACQVLDAFERWYADDVEMGENGAIPCVGKAASCEREKVFVASVAQWHGAHARPHPRGALR